jgi:hypothetical protein
MRVGFEVHHNPHIVFEERQIDHAFQETITFDAKSERVFAVTAWRGAGSLQHGMGQRGDHCGVSGRGLSFGRSQDTRVQFRQFADADGGRLEWRVAQHGVQQRAEALAADLP